MHSQSHYVLVLDDDDVIAKYAVMHLRRRGYRAARARTAAEAFESIRREMPDVLILDHYLPDTSGDEVLTALRADERTRLLPVIYLTIDGSRNRFRKSMTTGADDFLAKPFKPAELADAVEAQLRKAYARMIPHGDSGSDRDQAIRLGEEMRDLEARLATAYAERQRTQVELAVLNASIDHRVARETNLLERQNSALRAYGHALAHELRRPLRGILGFAGLLMHGHAASLPPDSRELLERIDSSGRRMNDFIEALLEMAQSGAGDLQRSEVDLSAMAADIVATDAGAPEGGEVRVAPGLMARSDPVLARIVLENLLSNARKYSARRPHPLVEFQATRIDGESVFLVRDNGAGFDMAAAASLFQPFKRLHSASEFEGLGIGLATVAQIVSRHGGRIWAEARPDAGATFYFTLEPASPVS